MGEVRTADLVIAAAVAQVMVVFARRGGQAPQVSALLAHRDHLHPAIHRVQDAVCAAPAEPWDNPRMAAVAHVTERHLARLFRLHAGLSPRAYVERVRVALAAQARDQGVSPAGAVQGSGFSSTRQMRQTMERQTRP